MICRKCAKLFPFLILMGTACLFIQLTFLFSTKESIAKYGDESSPQNTGVLQKVKAAGAQDHAARLLIAKETSNLKQLPLPKHGEINADRDPRFCKVQGLTEGSKCSSLTSGSLNDITQVQHIINGSWGENLKVIPDDAIIRWTFHCNVFKEKREYILEPLSAEEGAYPIAYSIVVHKEAAQVERLLHAIYMPQNLYCIHIDMKASDEFKQAIVNLASCFENVFIASKLENVIYATASRLQADLNCMEDLIRDKVKWKYLINLSGQDFPLKTNREIMQQLKAFKGLNDIPGVLADGFVKERTDFVYSVENGQVVHGRATKAPPPHNITIYFGNAYNVFSREYVHWVLNDKIPKDFLQWSQDTYSPDEHYWVSLQRIPGIPGGYPKATWGSTARAIKWSQYDGKLYPKCAGQYVRQVCVFGVGDLPWLTFQHHLFANKFDLNLDPVVVQCLEEWLKNRLLRLVNWSNFPHNLYGDN
ncbi:N-acetyllactosaminide beta-1,6-N-acetylglucosaminyl-transferase-like [Ptychodera flava]|uniref:N-acetyllactosaminide beta-1,6-N-acetylglucosaminyl-transferase-like n=1 Tax=Ptychodera flava TaxID=63121 RepID=UPI003969BF05